MMKGTLFLFHTMCWVIDIKYCKVVPIDCRSRSNLLWLNIGLKWNTQIEKDGCEDLLDVVGLHQIRESLRQLIGLHV